MTDAKRVLVVGLDPKLIDFSKPGYPIFRQRSSLVDNFIA
jgi:hypothetical protein